MKRILVMRSDNFVESTKLFPWTILLIIPSIFLSRKKMLSGVGTD